MPFIINNHYANDWAELSTTTTITVDQPFTLPVAVSGVYLIDVIYSIDGNYKLSIYKPDGGYVNFAARQSTLTTEDYQRVSVTINYAGSGTDWVLKCERYYSVDSDPPTKYKLHNISVVDSTDNTNYETIASELEIQLLDVLWHTYKNGTVMFEIPSSGAADETPDAPPATHYHYITGNVEKLGLPFEANVVAVSIGLNPEVLASTKSDAVTGDYTLDVYPYTDEVVLYVAPDYGVPYVPSFPMATGQIVHPTVPNKYVYVAQSDGALGINEPNWPTEGNFNSGTVTLTPVPLYRPLANGFVKPTIVPI